MENHPSSPGPSTQPIAGRGEDILRTDAWLDRTCQAASVLAAIAVAFVLLHGGGRWTFTGIRIRLDNPTNPLLVLAACQGARAWLAARRLPGWLRLERAVGMAGWILLAALIITLAIDRSVSRHSSTPWRQSVLMVGFAALALQARIRWARPGGVEGNTPGHNLGKEPSCAAGEGLSQTSVGEAGRSAVSARSLRSVLCLDFPTLAFIGMVSWALVSALASPFGQESLWEWEATWVLALGMFWATRLAWDRAVRPYGLYAVILMALGLAAFVSVLQLLVGHSPTDFTVGKPAGILERMTSSRVAGLSVHPNFLAALLAGLVMFVLAMGAMARSRARMMGLYALAALGFACLVLTRSRGGILAGLCGSVFVAAGSRRRWGVPVLLAGGVALAVLVGVHRERFVGLWHIVTSGEAPAELVGWRPYLWKFALAEIRQRPFLGWGTGQEGFEQVFFQAHPEARGRIEAFHCHNLYLETAFETGFTGVAVFAIVVGAAAGKAWRTRGRRSSAERPLALGATGALLVLLLHGLVDYPLNRGTWLFLGLIVAILAGKSHTYSGGSRGDEG